MNQTHVDLLVAAIKASGKSVRKWARETRIPTTRNYTTVRRWLSGESEMPDEVVEWLKAKKEWLKAQKAVDWLNANSNTVADVPRETGDSDGQEESQKEGGQEGHG